jgi:uncharacterized protein
VRRVFVDSGGFFAALAPKDTHHQRAKRLFQQADDEGWSLLTTNAVVLEVHALIINRTARGPALGLAFLDQVATGLCEVARVRPEDERTAVDLLRAHDDKGYSLCDALSFVVMERLGIDEAIAFDRHFRQYSPIRVL